MKLNSVLWGQDILSGYLELIQSWLDLIADTMCVKFENFFWMYYELENLFKSLKKEKKK